MITNCPNCNAVLSHENGLHCDYCGARFEPERPEPFYITLADMGASAEETARALARVWGKCNPSMGDRRLRC